MKSAKAPIRIAVLESDPLRFLGFRSILSGERDFELHTSTVDSILQKPDSDVILMTTSRGAAFYAAMGAFRTVFPPPRILVTGAGEKDEDILRALAAGAKGYIAEDATPEDFVQAIRAVHAGSVWAPGHVLSTFIERATASPRRLQPREEEDKISEREREVLRLLVAGRSNREIGAQLGIEERTVKAHVTQLMRKVGVQNRIALSVHAVTHSLLSTRFPS